MEKNEYSPKFDQTEKTVHDKNRFKTLKLEQTFVWIFFLYLNSRVKKMSRASLSSGLGRDTSTESDPGQMSALKNELSGPSKQMATAVSV